MKYQVWAMKDGLYKQFLDVTLEQLLFMAEAAARRGEPFQFMPM